MRVSRRRSSQLQQFRELRQKPEWSHRINLRRFLKEAETLIEEMPEDGLK